MRSRPSLGTLVAIAGLIATSACASADAIPRGAAVAIRGSVFTDHRMDAPCEVQAANLIRPDALSGMVLTFTTEAGQSLGTAVTGPLQWTDLDYGCRFHAEYALDVPTAAGYVVDFEPTVKPPPAGGYYSGADDLVPTYISHADLIAAAGVWSFEAMPSYVVP